MYKKRKQQGLKVKYSVYVLSAKEFITCLIKGSIILLVIAYFFYQSILPLLFGIIFLPIYFKRKKKELCDERKRRLQIQFKEMLRAVNNSLQAGYSMENAFTESREEMISLYGEDSDIVRELEEIIRGIKNNQTLEEKILDLGRRSGAEDIENFANMLFVGKRTGGNINEMIETAMSVIDEKVSLLQEIHTIIHAKKMEQKVMSVIPFFMITYVNFTGGGYFRALYHNPAGILIMTFCLGLYVASLLLAEKITAIQI